MASITAVAATNTPFVNTRAPMPHSFSLAPRRSSSLRGRPPQLRHRRTHGWATGRTATFLKSRIELYKMHK